jgi:hypothetical protein
MTRKIHYHNYCTKIAVKGTEARAFYFDSKVTRTGVVIIWLGAMFLNHKMVRGMHTMHGRVMVKAVA